MIPYLRTENLKNHTLSGGTYLYRPHMGVPPPPGGLLKTALKQKTLANITIPLKNFRKIFVIS